MGSTFKIFNTAMALDGGTSTLSDSYDATKPIRVGRFTIHDDHPKARWLSVPAIFKYSSNLGTVRMDLAAGAEPTPAVLTAPAMMTTSTVALETRRGTGR